MKQWSTFYFSLETLYYYLTFKLCICFTLKHKKYVCVYVCHICYKCRNSPKVGQMKTHIGNREISSKQISDPKPAFKVWSLLHKSFSLQVHKDPCLYLDLCTCSIFLLQIALNFFSSVMTSACLLRISKEPVLGLTSQEEFSRHIFQKQCLCLCPLVKL